jgi:hypothetical protein
MPASAVDPTVSTIADEELYLLDWLLITGEMSLFVDLPLASNLRWAPDA